MKLNKRNVLSTSPKLMQHFNVTLNLKENSYSYDHVSDERVLQEVINGTIKNII